MLARTASPPLSAVSTAHSPTGPPACTPSASAARPDSRTRHRTRVERFVQQRRGRHNTCSRVDRRQVEAHLLRTDIIGTEGLHQVRCGRGRVRDEVLFEVGERLHRSASFPRSSRSTRTSQSGPCRPRRCRSGWQPRWPVRPGRGMLLRSPLRSRRTLPRWCRTARRARRQHRTRRPPWAVKLWSKLPPKGCTLVIASLVGIEGDEVGRQAAVDKVGDAVPRAVRRNRQVVDASLVSGCRGQQGDGLRRQVDGREASTTHLPPERLCTRRCWPPATSRCRRGSHRQERRGPPGRRAPDRLAPHAATLRSEASTLDGTGRA